MLRAASDMQIVYCDRYHLDIGSHVFPTIKYRLIHQRLLERHVASPADFIAPEPATWDDLALVHTPEYIEKLRAGTMTTQEVALLEIPWSPAIVEGFRLMVGGTILAARLALAAARWNAVMHIGGGFHHAGRGHGEGFCMFNDVAVAIRRLQKDGAVARAAIVDCDVHHGNGTAAIFTGDRSVFTFSMHQLHNYPAVKPAGSLDIALDDWAGDDEYLEELAHALPRVFAWRPQLLFFLAGADPYLDDQLGGLRLTPAGLRARDRMVLEAAQAAGAPVAITLAGGYARRVEDTVNIHVATAEEAKRLLEPTSADGPAEC
jgi:acetoin utilization deacetylase AcuC-like enzyme